MLSEAKKVKLTNQINIMFKKLQYLTAAILVVVIMSADMLFAQQQVMIRDLNTYDVELTSQAVLPDHPLVGVDVTFDAVIVSYPRNSGLASITAAGQPGRLHVFIADTQAISEGLDGNFMQIVEDAPEQVNILTGLTRGDVVRIEGSLTFFNNTGQFKTTDIELLGDVFQPEFEDLAVLLEPTVISMEDLNIPSPTGDTFRWNAENYTKYINRYVKLEAVEIIDLLAEPDNGRPWYIMSNGESVLTSNDTSLRFRNDRTGYGDGNNIPFNWRRLAPELDGPFVPPPAGSVVDISGFVVVNTFNPGGFDESGPQSTLKIMPWDDGVLWLAEGEDPDFRFEPEGWPNDLQLLGFAPILDNFTATPGVDQEVFPTDNVSLSIDVILPEDDYTLESVVVEFEAFGPDADSGELQTEAMSQSGNTFTYSFNAFDAFTTVNYTIVATAQTPEGVATRARQQGSFYVLSTSQTAPAAFSPGGGTYQNAVAVTLTSATDEAQIFYTLDGSDPNDESTPYENPINLDQSAEIRAIAFSAGLDPSPITSRTYEVVIDAPEAETIAQVRNHPQDGSDVFFTGEAVITYTRTTRNQRYMQDDTGGVLIDDPGAGVIQSEYNIGSIMTNLLGSMGAFQGVFQFAPSLDPGPSPGTAPVPSPQVTLAELNIPEYESRLVFIENVTFLDAEGNFEGATNYQITDPSLDPEETFILRTNFAESNVIGTPIPTEAVNLTAIVGNFNGTMQLIPRFDSDITPFTNINDDERPIEFRLAQNYPNPFNPTTNISYSLANIADVNLVVYDILGRRVATLVNARQQMPGTYNVSFDASRLASGTYIYRLEAGDFVSVKKMMLIK